MTADDRAIVGGRTPSGQFAPGNRHGRGRRPGESVTSVLRRIVDPEAVARRLYEIALGPNDKLALAAIAELQDRTEGKSVARSVRINAAADALPPGWDALPPASRRQILLDLRRRAVTGTLPQLAPGADPPVTGYDDEEHEQ